MSGGSSKKGCWSVEPEEDWSLSSKRGLLIFVVLFNNYFFWIMNWVVSHMLMTGFPWGPRSYGGGCDGLLVWPVPLCLVCSVLQGVWFLLVSEIGDTWAQVFHAFISLPLPLFQWSPSLPCICCFVHATRNSIRSIHPNMHFILLTYWFSHLMVKLCYVSCCISVFV